MENKWFITLTLPLLVLVSSKSMALPTVAQPQNCPSVAEIQAVGVSNTPVQDSDGLWFTGRRDQVYNTGSRWSFVIGKISATSTSDAYNKANLGLNTLSFELGPVVGPIGKWVCYYRTTNFGYQAIAINPPIAINHVVPYLK